MPVLTTSRAILALAAGQTLVWAGLYYLFPALILAWEAELGLSRSTLTLSFSLALGTAAVASPLAGRAVDAGQGPILLAGSALLGAAALGLLPAVAHSPAGFAFCWAVIGLAMAGCLYEPCFAFVTRARGAAARRAITLITLVAGFASTLAFPLAGWLAAAGGWQTATVVFALLIALVAAPLLWAGGLALERTREAPPGPASPAAPSPGPGAILRRPGFPMLALAFAAVALIHGVIINHLLPILAERGVASSTAILAAAMIGPMQVAGRLAMLAGERRLPAGPTTVMCLGGMAAAATALLGATWLPLLALFVVLQGACYGTTTILKPVVVAERLGQVDFGAAIGLMAVPYLAASALAPFLGTALWRVAGYDGVLIAIALLALMAAAAIAAVNANVK